MIVLSKKERTFNIAKQKFLQGNDLDEFQRVLNICKKHPKDAKFRALREAVEKALIRDNPIWGL